MDRFDTGSIEFYVVTYFQIFLLRVKIFILIVKHENRSRMRFNGLTRCGDSTFDKYLISKNFGLGRLTGPPSTQRELFQTMGQRFKWALEQIKISFFPRENF